MEYICNDGIHWSTLSQPKRQVYSKHEYICIFNLEAVAPKTEQTLRQTVAIHIWRLDIAIIEYGSLTRYIQLRVVHAPGMSGTFSSPPRVSDPWVSDPYMHYGTCVTHVPWSMPESLTSGFLWSRWRGKMFPAFPVHAHPANLRIW